MPTNSLYTSLPKSDSSGPDTAVKRGFIQRLIIGKEPDDFRATKIKLLRGQTALLCMFTGTVYAVLLGVMGDFNMLPWELVLVAGGTLAFYLNRIQYYTTSTIILFVLTNGLVYLFTAVDRPQEGTFFFYFMSSSISIVLMWYYNRYLAVTMVGITIVLAILAFFYPVYIILPPRGATPAIERIVFAINLTVCLAFSAYVLLSVLRENFYTENKLIQNHQELKKANEELDRFVYSASHDMRAPLSSLLGLINVAEKTQTPHEIATCLTMMRQRIVVMDVLLKEVTDYSRNVRTEVIINPFNLARCIQTSVAALDFLPGYDKIKISIRVEPALVIHTHEPRFSAILNNLLSNAIKYCDPQKNNPFITISAVVKNNHLMLRVEDNGLGITAEHQARIFDMFYRATVHGEGSGLGLYIVRETLHKLGGTIEVQSSPGEGSVFTLHLPQP